MDLLGPLKSLINRSSFLLKDMYYTLEPSTSFYKQPTALERLFGVSSQLERAESKTSLPDATTLDHSPVPMSREEVSRLSSQRREELRRMREEDELLRRNPLRYLFHPAVRVS